MTIENARVLQEQLANEAIAQLRKNGGNELADDCIRSIAVVGKAWGIPADETARRQACTQQEQTQRVGDAKPRENTADSDMLHPAPNKAVKVMRLVWDMFEMALDLGDDADRYRLFDTAHVLAKVHLYIKQINVKRYVLRQCICFVETSACCKTGAIALAIRQKPRSLGWIPSTVHNSLSVVPNSVSPSIKYTNGSPVATAF